MRLYSRLSERQKLARGTKNSAEYKVCDDFVHVRCWMKAIPEDVIIWVRHQDTTVKRQVGEPYAICKSKPGGFKNYRVSNQVYVHDIDVDSMLQGKSRQLEIHHKVCGEYKSLR